MEEEEEEEAGCDDDDDCDERGINSGAFTAFLSADSVLDSVSFDVGVEPLPETFCSGCVFFFFSSSSSLRLCISAVAFSNFCWYFRLIRTHFLCQSAYRRKKR